MRGACKKHEIIPEIASMKYFSNVLLLDFSTVTLCVSCIAYTYLLHFYAFDFRFHFPLQLIYYVFTSFVRVEIASPTFKL